MNIEQEEAFEAGYQFAKKEIENKKVNPEEKIDPIKCVDFMRDNSDALGEAEGHLTYLVEFRKSKKALLMNESTAKTESGKESYAYSHPEYIAVLEGIEIAKNKCIRLRWLMTTAQIKVEIWRSLESSARAEGKATQ
jgi:hypothetical protein